MKNTYILYHVKQTFYEKAVIHHVGLATASAQQLKKVNATFRLGAFKPGE
jgi:hypothetical protein